MCVIFFYVNSNPGSFGYKLILASNRDEFYKRDTLSVSQWANAEHVYGGIDLEPGREGGTWLAISGRNGVLKLGALLNLTGEPKPHGAVGRGMIVADFVTGTDIETSIAKYNRRLVKDCTKYSAFNFVSVEIGKSAPAHIKLCSNKPPMLTDYEDGKTYGFGNSLPDVPFEKVRIGQQDFDLIVRNFNNKICDNVDNITRKQHQTELIKALNQFLRNKTKYWPDDELKRRAPNWGEHLSAINVIMPWVGYGSRTHTVILIDANNKMHFFEETMVGLDPDGEWKQTHLESQLT